MGSRGDIHRNQVVMSTVREPDNAHCATAQVRATRTCSTSTSRGRYARRQ
ncbi:hypothetical protein DB32_000799 [Sandaracinus amylolyticus]|uniref:Uncharacterized protein n=1 Tax=Sandaracinus amylolyticus TaxID=927083 RepID=A0A0F6VZK1_9BACT|nr:hypothetical protein DB32_000799 [Sandaracinus amylolyticus]